MRRIILSILLILVGIALVSGSHFGTGQTPKEVKGIINLDTMWTKENSPYTLSAPVAINSGVTLTIEPGVIVNLKGYYIQVNGTLIAKGTGIDRIQFNGEGTLKFTGLSNSWNEQTGSGCIIENANVSLTIIQINDASPNIRNSYITTGISINGGSPIISSNVIQTVGMSEVINVDKGSPVIISNNISTKCLDDLGNPDTSYGIRMNNATNAYISDNTFGGFGYSSIYAGTSSAIIQKNKLWSGIEGGMHLVVQNNTISGGITSPSSFSTIVYNNILSGGVQLTSAESINASYNWWGTTDEAIISQSIVDNKNDFNLGTVTFVPFLTEANPQAIPDPNAPIPTPNTSPTSAPTSNPSTSPTRNPTATPTQPGSGTAVLLGLDWMQITTLILLAIIAVLLVFVVVYLRKRSVSKLV